MERDAIYTIGIGLIAVLGVSYIAGQLAAGAAHRKKLAALKLEQARLIGGMEALDEVRNIMAGAPRPSAKPARPTWRPRVIDGDKSS